MAGSQAVSLFLPFFLPPPWSVAWPWSEAGALASLPLTLSLSGSGATVPTGSTVVVAEIRNIKGVDRLVIVALGQVDASDVMTTQVIGGETLPGVRQSGRFGFYRVEGDVAAVRGLARTDTGQRAGHVTELAALPFVSCSANAAALATLLQCSTTALSLGALSISRVALPAVEDS